MNFNINEIKKSVVLDSHQAVHAHRQRINQILLANDAQLAKEIFDLEKKQLVAYTLSADYESLFSMRCSRLLPDEIWRDVETMMYRTLTSVPFMKDFWRQNRPSHSANFASYIDTLTNSKEINYAQESTFCR